MAAVRPEQPVPTMMTFSISDDIGVQFMRFEIRQSVDSIKSTAFAIAPAKDVLSSSTLTLTE